MRVPFLGFVAAGFASPASDYSEDEIDLARILQAKPSVFHVRVTSDSMIDANIPEGAILVVDKALTPKNYSIVIAYLDGEFTVKHYVKDFNGISLVPANPKYKPIRITEGMRFEVWGVVTAVVIEKVRI